MLQHIDHDRLRGFLRQIILGDVGTMVDHHVSFSGEHGQHVGFIDHPIGSFLEIITTNDTDTVCDILRSLPIGFLHRIILEIMQIGEHVCHMQLGIGDLIHALDGVELSLSRLRMLRKNPEEDDDLIGIEGHQTIDEKRTSTRASATRSRCCHNDNIGFLDHIGKSRSLIEEAFELDGQKPFGILTVLTCTTLVADEEGRNGLIQDLIVQILLARVDAEDGVALLASHFDCLATSVANTDE